MAKITYSIPATTPPVGKAPREERPHSKVTYSLPGPIVDELDRRAGQRRQAKSAIVSEALAFYFAEQDREALAAVYAEAARDVDFAFDNDEVLRDFAAIDRETAQDAE